MTSSSHPLFSMGEASARVLHSCGLTPMAAPLHFPRMFERRRRSDDDHNQCQEGEGKGMKFMSTTSSVILDNGKLWVGLSIGFALGLQGWRVRLWYVKWQLKRLSLPHQILLPLGFKEDFVSRRLGYTVGYSFSLKSPVWVTFLVNKDLVETASKVPRSLQFSADQSLPRAFRRSAGSYRGVAGYDRGHLAPHAAVGYCRESSDETFLLSNVILQHPTINRHSWKALEAAVRRYVVSAGGLHKRPLVSSQQQQQHPMTMVAVTVGPIFSRTTVQRWSTTVDVKEPPIPSACFMALYDTTSGESTSFVVSNTASGRAKQMSLTKLEAMLDEVRRGDNHSLLDDAEAAATVAVPASPWRRRFPFVSWRWLWWLWRRRTSKQREEEEENNDEPPFVLFYRFRAPSTVAASTLQSSVSSRGSWFTRRRWWWWRLGGRHSTNRCCYTSPTCSPMPNAVLITDLCKKLPLLESKTKRQQHRRHSSRAVKKSSTQVAESR